MDDDPTTESAPRAPAAPVATFRTEQGDRVVVHVAGELDADSGAQLRSILSEAFEERPQAVAVDFTELVFIDSVGLSVLVAAHQRGQADGIGFEVHSVPPGCMRVLEITSLDQVLDLR